MATFLIDRAFAEHPAVTAVIGRLGLVGYARFILTAQQSSQAGVVTLRYSEWLDLLSASPDEFSQFIEVTGDIGAFFLAGHTADSNLVTVILSDSLKALLLTPLADEVVLTTASQWERYCLDELTFPLWLVNDPATQSLFRRWCASNVSMGEMKEAVDLAIAANDLKPVGLHEQLATIRARRLAAARQHA